MGQSKRTQDIDAFRDGDFETAMTKTASQKAKKDVVESIKRLTREGKHPDAQALYKEQFGKV